MKKSTKICAGITAFLLIIGVMWFANGLLGNPISKTISNNSAKEYIEKNYPNMDLNISDAFYNFKTGTYDSEVKSPTSKDTHFYLSISSLGKITYNSYENDVVDRYNTFNRINESYSSKMEKVFDSNDFPYESEINFGAIMDIENLEINKNNGLTYPIYGIDLKKLELDKDYDMYEMGKKAGHIVFYAEDEEITVKKASEILLNIKNILDKKNISFYAIDFILEKPRNEEGTPSSDDASIRIEHFLYEDIYEENLEQRISKAEKDLKKYYEIIDSKKEELEIE
ncbi:YfjL-like protein [Terrisporobacter sp.]|uniref:YfjL-like protein n=1 Tax=Terrisporobacter sp. TaxID=1965305 RepID=UPI002636CD48|nr:hypothetical protein [Terrisporobacter sp.]